MITSKSLRQNLFTLALPIFIISTVTIYKAANLGAKDISSTSKYIEIKGEGLVRQLKESKTELPEPREKTKPLSPSNGTVKPDTLYIQAERQKRVEEVCQKYRNLKSRSSSGVPFKLSKKYGYLYCPVPKAGWSSWKRVWFYASGVIQSYDTDVGIAKDTEAGVLDLNRESSVVHSWEQREYNYSFVFVRDPWERLVSAYINKAVEYNYSRILHTPCRWESMEPYKPDLTFLQFLTCIVEGSREMHWAPQWSICNVCRIKFDFIGHIESAGDDAAFVLSKLGINATYPHSFASKIMSTKKVMNELYKNLPAELLKKLAAIYQYDFELHGYSKIPPGRPDVV